MSLTTARRNGARLDPHDLDAEEVTVGAMMLSTEGLLSVIDAGLSAADFYRSALGLVFDAACSLYGRGEPVSPVTVADELRRSGKLEHVGGPATLLGLQANCPTMGNVSHHAAIVSRHALARRMLGELRASVERLVESADPQEVLADIESRLAALTPGTGGLVGMREVLEDRLDEIERRYSGEVEVGLSTGFVDLDEMIGGLKPANLVVVAGRPAMSKTSLASNISAEVGKAGRSVLVFSAEMSVGELGDRMLAHEGHVDLSRILSGQLSAADWPRLSLAVGRLAESPIWIDDTPSIPMSTLRAVAHRVHRRTPLSLIVVDFVQLVGGGKRENRQVTVSENVAALKHLARTLKIPVLALAQVNRAVESRSDRRPTLADLRESGEVEVQADVVIGLYRDEAYDPNSRDRGQAELIVLKNRNGPTGTVRLAWMGAHTRFGNLARV